VKDLLVYLLSMVVVVPLAKRVGLGSVIGYLIAGVIIGPQCLALIGSAGMGSHDQMSELSEFGVIMMLLLIGLELNPQLLWKMRGPIFGLGGIQVLATTALFTGGAMAFGFDWPVALTIGMIVSASSTAIVLQTLKERGYAKSVGGERTFAVLLFQDLAVIPILAVLPLLGGDGVQETGLNLSAGMKTLFILGAVAAVVLAGRFLIRPLFKIISRTKLRETFTALALLIVVGAAALMHAVGLSPALGAFLAGVVLADSEFRHQIEADIEPFKGLLLGLFFITVGSNISFVVIAANPLIVLGTIAAIVFGKAALVYALGRSAKMKPPESLLFAVALAQGGEFAFVLIGQAGGLLSPEVAQILTASVALSMALAPLLIGLTITHGMSRLECITEETRAPDLIDESARLNPVLVIGVGRFGQTLIRFLNANGIRSTVLDMDSEQIEIMARFGIKSYFGDGANVDLLRAAGIENARALVLAIDEPETAIRIVEEIKRIYPELPIFSRAYDRIHAYKLLHLGVEEIAIETSGSALSLGVEVLKKLGVSSVRAFRNSQVFKKNNDRSIRELAKRFHEDDRETFIQASRQSSEQLEAIFETDPTQLHQDGDIGWHAPPPSEKS
jgi:monovalent cation:proton antiporter-2 (CPA2) family protein